MAAVCQVFHRFRVRVFVSDVGQTMRAVLPVTIASRSKKREYTRNWQKVSDQGASTCPLTVSIRGAAEGGAMIDGNNSVNLSAHRRFVQNPL